MHWQPQHLPLHPLQLPLPFRLTLTSAVLQAGGPRALGARAAARGGAPTRPSKRLMQHVPALSNLVYHQRRHVTLRENADRGHCPSSVCLSEWPPT